MSEDTPKVAVVAGTGAGAARALTGTAGAVIKDQIGTLPPDITGALGRAWRVNFSAMLQLHAAKPGEDATIGLWLIEAPWAHPIWHSYIIGLVHLRPTEKGAAPVIIMGGATHQFWLWAANPDQPRAPFIKGELRAIPFLSPVNFSSQLRCTNDEAAKGLMEHTIRQICAGVLSPDTDAFREWVRRFGDSMVRPEYR